VARVSSGGNGDFKATALFFFFPPFLLLFPLPGAVPPPSQHFEWPIGEGIAELEKDIGGDSNQELLFPLLPPVLPSVSPLLRLFTHDLEHLGPIPFGERFFFPFLLSSQLHLMGSPRRSAGSERCERGDADRSSLPFLFSPPSPFLFHSILLSQRAAARRTVHVRRDDDRETKKRRGYSSLDARGLFFLFLPSLPLLLALFIWDRGVRRLPDNLQRLAGTGDTLYVNGRK